MTTWIGLSPPTGALHSYDVLDNMIQKEGATLGYGDQADGTHIIPQ